MALRSAWRHSIGLGSPPSEPERVERADDRASWTRSRMSSACVSNPLCPRNPHKRHSTDTFLTSARSSTISSTGSSRSKRRTSGSSLIDNQSRQRSLLHHRVAHLRDWTRIRMIDAQQGHQHRMAQAAPLRRRPRCQRQRSPRHRHLRRGSGRKLAQLHQMPFDHHVCASRMPINLADRVHQRQSQPSLLQWSDISLRTTQSHHLRLDHTVPRQPLLPLHLNPRLLILTDLAGTVLATHVQSRTSPPTPNLPTARPFDRRPRRIH